MKRKLTSILIASTLVLSVGCSSKDNENTSTDTSTTNILSKNNEKEVYKIYTTLLPKVKEVYNQYGFKYEDYDNIESKYYNGPKGILYEKFDDISHGDIINATYTVDLSTGTASEVYADLYMEVNSDEIANNGFKIEDTFFAAMDKLMIGKEIDYTELNKNIVNAYKNGGFYDETIEYENGNCRITTDSTMIQYTIGIYPEE